MNNEKNDDGLWIFKLLTEKVGGRIKITFIWKIFAHFFSHAGC